MEIETLDSLKVAFEEWRNQKRHPREAIPAKLLERARKAAQHHGPAEVDRITKVGRGRLKLESAGRRGRRTAAVPTFSRVELVGPTPAARPFAEVDTAAGLKIRIFAQTTEALELISSLCGLGAAR